jgi:hypothetical protein
LTSSRGIAVLKDLLDSSKYREAITPMFLPLTVQFSVVYVGSDIQVGEVFISETPQL